MIKIPSLPSEIFHMHNELGNSLIHEVVLQENRKSRNAKVHYLITYGSCVNAQNKNGDTPLHLALEKRNRPLIALLLAKGADTALENNAQQSVFEMLIENNRLLNLLKTLVFSSISQK